MGFYYKLELSKNEIMLLQACEKFTDALPKKLPPGKSAARDLVWREHVLPTLNLFKASCVIARALQNNGLIETDAGWRITEKGRLVLGLIKRELSEV